MKIKTCNLWEGMSEEKLADLNTVFDSIKRRAEFFKLPICLWSIILVQTHSTVGPHLT